MIDLAGKQLKDYRILRRLGRGGMAQVYLAEQKSLARQVALKVLNADLVDDATYVERFHQEARAAAALVHGSIVQIYEVGCVDGVHFIAQEYVAGGNVGELIRRQTRIDPGTTLEIICQVATALLKASEHGIVHRDIKPENVLLGRDGEVKVADFGLARVMGGAAPTQQLTEVGVTLGTPLYMSPEQIEGRPLDGRSDIYSLGVTAYHMLSGEPPYQADTALAVAVGHLNAPTPLVIDRAPDVPLRLAKSVERMMAKKPAQRHANAAELIADLRSIAVEAAEQGWGSGPENWSQAGLVTRGQPSHDVTARLEAVMKASSAATPRGPSKRRVLGLLAASLLVGAFWGIRTRPRWLLAGARSNVPQRESVWAQLYHAKLVDTESGWRAVMEVFPDEDLYYHDLARQGLVRHYFRSGQFGKAVEPLRELATRLDGQGTFRSFGLAGLTIVYAKAGRIADARKARQQLTAPMRRQLEEADPGLSKVFAAVDRELARQ